MGLNNYFIGYKYRHENIFGSWNNQELHDFIISNFSILDNSQTIELAEEELNEILEAINDKRLHDDNDYIKKAVKDAVRWMKEREAGYTKSIMYQASW